MAKSALGALSVALLVSTVAACGADRAPAVDQSSSAASAADPGTTTSTTTTSATTTTTADDTVAAAGTTRVQLVGDPGFEAGTTDHWSMAGNSAGMGVDKTTPISGTASVHFSSAIHAFSYDGQFAPGYPVWQRTDLANVKASQVDIRMNVRNKDVTLPNGVVTPTDIKSYCVAVAYDGAVAAHDSSVTNLGKWETKCSDAVADASGTVQRITISMPLSTAANVTGVVVEASRGTSQTPIDVEIDDFSVYLTEVTPVVAGGAGGSTGSGTSPSPSPTPTPSIGLCAGLVQDQLPHTQTPLAKPAVGQVVVDAEFGTKIRRITAASTTDKGIIPMYSTIPAWNADESLMILYRVSDGAHLLYDGRTYQFIQTLPIHPSDIEQVFWHTSDPDVFFFPQMGTKNFVRYHVKSGMQEILKTFDTSVCSGANDSITNGGDPMFTSWDSGRIGLACGRWTPDWSTYTGTSFIYDIKNNAVLGKRDIPARSSTPNPPQASASGTLAYSETGAGDVMDPLSLNVVRSLQLANPANHASLGRLANGHDTWNGAVYDPLSGPDVDAIGNLVTWDMVTGTGRVIIGPKTGYPIYFHSPDYAIDGHISAMAYKQPGWISVSTISPQTTTAQNLMDQELMLADTNTGTVCRVGRHRSTGKHNTVVGYWAEPHAVPSPSGTRILFGSDWGGGSTNNNPTVDSFVVELPSYVPGS